MQFFLYTAKVQSSYVAVDVKTRFWSIESDKSVLPSAIVRYELQAWNPANRMWDTVRNDLPSTRLSYKRSGLTAGTRYVYRLRGVNRAADNNGLGNWSVLTFPTTAEWRGSVRTVPSHGRDAPRPRPGAVSSFGGSA